MLRRLGCPTRYGALAVFVLVASGCAGGTIERMGSHAAVGSQYQHFGPPEGKQFLSADPPASLAYAPSQHSVVHAVAAGKGSFSGAGGHAGGAGHGGGSGSGSGR